MQGYDDYSGRIETEPNMGYHDGYEMTQNEYMLAMKDKQRRFESMHQGEVDPNFFKDDRLPKPEDRLPKPAI